MTTTAVLVMDVQRGIVDRYGQDSGYLPRLRRVTEAARGAGHRVIYVTVTFRPGHPEISARNKSFAALARMEGLSDTDPAAAIHPAVAPVPDDIV
ncbi:MAG TPA: isochorismatase family protein, partial [Chloroflexota bacterium]